MICPIATWHQADKNRHTLTGKQIALTFITEGVPLSAWQTQILSSMSSHLHSTVCVYIDQEDS